MKQSERLRPVVEMARESEQAAARELAEARSGVASAEQKLAELEAYRDEYLEGLRYKTRTGLNAMQMKDYRVFLGRLDDAIQQQVKVLAGQVAAAGEVLQAWQGEKQRFDALDKLADRHLCRDHMDSDRREQAESNEQALRNWRRVPG